MGKQCHKSVLLKKSAFRNPTMNLKNLRSLGLIVADTDLPLKKYVV